MPAVIPGGNVESYSLHKLFAALALDKRVLINLTDQDICLIYYWHYLL